ncbi:hypothetical protein BBJ28_00023582 [Nothophytophthora sp. Chile5]|nr:hypothetical protein BBJ28_00023582 [Nothophytophthora sp. Chile5]
MKSLLDTHNEDRAALVAHVEQLRPLSKPKRLLLTKLDKDSKCQITAGTAPYVKRQERKLTYTRNQEYSASMGVSDPKKIKSEIVSTGGERLKRALSEDSEAMVRTKIKGVLYDITFEEEHILFYASMDKDLRDAYAALKLLRKDLVQTKRSKQALEAAVAHLQAHGPPPSASQTREVRETQLMREEDFQAQLLQLQRLHDARLVALIAQKVCSRRQPQEDGDENAGDPERPGTSSDDGRQDLGKQKQTAPEADTDSGNQREEAEEAESNADVMVREKLELLAKLHSQKATMEQQTQAILTQQAEFALATGELQTRLEEAQLDSEQAQSRALEAQHEQQATTEKDAFLTTQLELLSREKRELEAKVDQIQTDRVHDQQALEAERTKAESLQEELVLVAEQHREEKRQLESKLAAHAQTSSILKQQLVEKEEEEASSQSQQEQQELTLQLEHEQKIDALVEELSATFRKEQQLREQQLRSEHQREVVDLQQKNAFLELQLSSEKEKALQAQQEAQARCAATLRDMESYSAEVQALLAASKLECEAVAKEKELILAEAEQRLTQHDEAVRALATEKEALQQEVCEARQTTKLTTEELLERQATLEQKRQDALRCLAREQQQCRSLETQLLAAEDHKVSPATVEAEPETLKAFHGLTATGLAALPATEAWAVMRRGLRELDGVLPRLQTLLTTVNDALTLCERHADALPSLCEQLESQAMDEEPTPPIVTTALELLRFVEMLQHQSRQKTELGSLTTVRGFRRRVLNALALWYECDPSQDDSSQTESEAVPTPAFAIASRETALILQNWTRDRTKQLGVKRWLARMEAYPAAPPVRGAAEKSGRVLELPREGCTLDLEDMTLEVKDAFRLLLVPILKQNRAIHVRVFTRYAAADLDAPKTPRRHLLQQGVGDQEQTAEKLWAMRIHVQSAAIRRRSHGEGARPPPLLTSGLHDPLSPLAATSPASSVSSSTSSTASSRLQIIQERLQFLHTNG